MAIRIDTGKVNEAALFISNRSGQLKSRFNDLKGTYTKQSRCWGGTAGDAALVRFRALLYENGDPRGPYLDRFVGFMQNQVGGGYEDTEAAVTSAAELFK